MGTPTVHRSLTPLGRDHALHRQLRGRGWHPAEDDDGARMRPVRHHPAREDGSDVKDYEAFIRYVLAPVAGERRHLPAIYDENSPTKGRSRATCSAVARFASRSPCVSPDPDRTQARVRADDPGGGEVSAEANVDSYPAGRAATASASSNARIVGIDGFIADRWRRGRRLRSRRRRRRSQVAGCSRRRPPASRSRVRPRQAPSSRRYRHRHWRPRLYLRKCPHAVLRGGSRHRNRPPLPPMVPPLPPTPPASM